MAGEPTKPKSDREVPSRKDGSLPEGRTSSSEDIAAFVAKARAMSPHAAGGRGRLVFALDATMSRQPTWDTACRLQADMFREAAAIGGLDVQLVYYRGLSECRASRWVSQADRLGALMERIDCRGGHSQIGKIIAHTKRETQSLRVQALVFVGDAMEEKLDDLCHAAGELGLLGVPAFVFQEDSVHRRASLLARFELLGSYADKNRFLERLRAVTAADIQRVARAYFADDKKNVGVLLPRR